MTRQAWVIGVVLLGCWAGGANGEIIYTNDFGTAQQFQALTWSGIAGAGLSGLIREGEGTGVVDLDGDGLYESVAQSTQDVGWGGSRGVKVIYAPPYHLMTIEKFSGYLSGHSGNWGTSASLRLSYDGTDYNYAVASDDSATLKSYSVSPSPTDPNYINCSQVWIAVDLVSYNNSIPSWAWGRAAALKLEGALTPGGPGDTVVVHSNDLGTSQQFDEWIRSGPIAWQDDSPGFDTDGDGKGGRVEVYQPGPAWMMTRIDAPPGLAFAYPQAMGMGYGSAQSHGSSTQLQLSLDGYHWDHSSTFPPSPTWYAMSVDSAGDEDYAMVESFWLRVYMASTNVGSLPQAHSITASATLVAGTDPYCGQTGTTYLAADINQDCYVDMLDLALLAQQWLACNDPIGDCD